MPDVRAPRSAARSPCSSTRLRGFYERYQDHMFERSDRRNSALHTVAGGRPHLFRSRCGARGPICGARRDPAQDVLKLGIAARQPNLARQDLPGVDERVELPNDLQKPAPTLWIELVGDGRVVACIDRVGEQAAPPLSSDAMYTRARRFTRWGLGMGLGQKWGTPFGGLVPAVGIEPTTNGLQNRCSTPELCRQA